MRIISFAWTTPALLAGEKTCTRRDWSDDYAKSFHEGNLVAAYDRSPRVGGKQVATIQLTRDPFKQFTASIADSDWYAEGFEYLTKIGVRVNGLTPKELWQRWRTHPQLLWVVRFQMIEEAK